MKTIIGYAVLTMLAIGSPALAQVESKKTTVHRDGVVDTTERLKKGNQVEKVSCRAFNALDESFKPQAVAYAVDYTRKGKPKDPTIDVAGTEKVTPVVIADCKAHPEQTLLARIKAAFHR